MKTTIDNNLRVFQVITSTSQQIFCNLNQLNEVIKELNCKVGYFKIYHFWNNKPEKLTRKYLSELFRANQIKQEFYY